MRTSHLVNFFNEVLAGGVGQLLVVAADLRRRQVGLFAKVFHGPGENKSELDLNPRSLCPFYLWDFLQQYSALLPTEVFLILQD